MVLLDVHDCALSVHTTLEQPAASLFASEKEFAVVISLKCLSTEQSSAPLFLVAVLDKSSSMEGAKLASLKDTMHRLINKLRPIDTLAIVTYDSDASVLLRPTLLNDEGKQGAKSLVDKISPGSMTNLSGGLIEGLYQIPRNLESNVIVSTLLLTDGLANQGITKSQAIISMIKQLSERAHGPGKSVVYTFGYGDDHNSAMLTDIATATQGMYYYIQNEDKISEAFSDVLGGLLSVVVQNVVVTITAPPDVEITQFLPDIPHTVVEKTKQIRVQFADLQAEEFRDLPVLIKYPAVTGAIESPLFDVQVDCFNVLSNQMESTSTQAVLPRLDVSQLTPELTMKNLDVDSHLNRLETCKVLDNAKSFADKGDVQAARHLLQQQINKIQNSASALMPVCKRLLVDLTGALDKMTSASEYKSRGSHHLNNARACHVRQRAAPQSYAEEFVGYTYCNAARFDMLNKF
jgi:Ca-activated chloride channel family protein